MDQLVASLAALCGVNPSTLVLLLGVLVAVANLLGKLIPNNATGWAAGLRTASRVIGLYVSDHVTPGITVKDVAQASVEDAGLTPKTSNSTLKCAPISVFLAGALVLLLTGCTTAQTQRVESVASALCTSVPLAQTVYNVALQNHDTATVNSILNTINLSCPGVLGLMHVYEQQQVPAPVAPPELPPITPERG